MIVLALIKLRPHAKWKVNGDTYADIEWLDENETKPTEAEVNQAVTEVTAERESNLYKGQRREAYGSIESQLDMLYWDKKNGTNKWVEFVDKIKTDIPKE
tara:strand:+ start:1837 stop:2136 length:300 start_codon:yes stop_codon:yes gene_type:complete